MKRTVKLQVSMDRWGIVTVCDKDSHLSMGNSTEIEDVLKGLLGSKFDSVYREIVHGWTEHVNVFHASWDAYSEVTEKGGFES